MGHKHALSTILFIIIAVVRAYAKDAGIQPADISANPQNSWRETLVGPGSDPYLADREVSDASKEIIRVDFKEADIRNVLKLISYKAGVNIVAGPEVQGAVTISLVDVHWREALKTIISTYGYGYDQRGNIIIVAPIDKLTEQKRQEVELAQVQPTVTEVFNLKYIDASDTKKAIEPQLSGRGKITILESTGHAGWEFGGVDEVGKRKRIYEGRVSRSKTLIVTDIPPALDRIRDIINSIDVKPRQILIETRIMEANKDRLRDIGLDWGTGSSGASSPTGALTFTPAGKSKSGTDTSQIAAHGLSDLITPSTFGPKSSGLTTVNTGLRLAFRRLTGAQFEAILHALEEDVTANTLSAPRVLTLNNQEAAILVGQKYPLVKTDVSTESGKITGSTLQKYQDIGIQLNVVPQICEKDFINMIIHPAITSFTETLEIKSETGAILSKYPIINTREAETQILIKDGETVVIGGLLKDVKTRSRIGIPFLGSIPIIGLLFQRETNDIEKIDLLIFITARILKEGEFGDAYIATLEERLDTFGPKKPKKK
jgi:type IV pilus assembly protein PilQ